ncbi:MAG: DUF2608 domain-containing protein [Holosporaceae bacterium]|nr:DUF2608 domain-containing protein [Holosporaceae bacterium]
MIKTFASFFGSLAFAVSFAADSSQTPPPPPPPSLQLQPPSPPPPLQSGGRISYRERQEALKAEQQAKQKAEWEAGWKAVVDCLSGKRSDNPNYNRFNELSERLRRGKIPNIVRISLPPDTENLSVLPRLIQSKYPAKKTLVAVDFDNTVTRMLSLAGETFPQENVDLLNQLPLWMVVTASRAEGPEGKVSRLQRAGVTSLPAMRAKFGNADLPAVTSSLLTVIPFESGQESSIRYGSSSFEVVNLELQKAGNVFFAALPRENVPIDGKLPYNPSELVRKLEESGLGSSNGYHKGAAIREAIDILPKEEKPQVLVVVDDTLGNLENVDKAAQSGLFNDMSEIVLIWIQPTLYQQRENFGSQGFKDKFRPMDLPEDSAARA